MPSFCVLFFGLVAGVALLQIFGSSQLYLNGEGFEQRMMGRKLECRWEEVSEFHVWETGGNRFVGFTRNEDEGKAIAKINRAVSGGSASLGDTFGMSAEALADLMNAYRESALARRR